MAYAFLVSSYDPKDLCGYAKFEAVSIDFAYLKKLSRKSLNYEENLTFSVNLNKKFLSRLTKFLGFEPLQSGHLFLMESMLTSFPFLN